MHRGPITILEENHYYPFGMKHSYNSSIREWSGSVETGDLQAVLMQVERGKYQYKYNGKEYQDELGLNLYDMDFRDYDPAIGRWTGIDPVTHHSMSTYNAFDGNPVFWADPSGADATITDNAVTFDGADAQVFITAFIGLMDGNDSSFTIAGAIYDLTDIADGNYTGIIVGSNGIVYDKFGSGSNYRIFDRKGQQLKRNDYANDSQWFGTIGVGDRLYHSISVATFASMILDAGVKIRGGIGGYYNIAWQSHMGGADFGARQIANKFDIPYAKTEYSTAGLSDGNFFRFVNQKSIYNLADAGNFMWGAWMKGNGFFLFQAKAGAHLNNAVFGTGIFDAPADQRAITNGYNYLNNLILSWRKK